MSFKAIMNREAPSRFGFRSMLLLAKLGFDLRAQYEDVLTEPLPDEMKQALARLADG